MRTLIDKANISRSFWNDKARENPYWYVSSYGAYDSVRNLEEFWASGARIWDDLKTATGYQPGITDQIVEIGCGVGRLTRWIAREAGSVQAFDISGEMLKIAAEADLPNVTFRLAEGFNLKPLNDGCADLALGYCVFQHLPSVGALQSYIREMIRVTKKGGLIAFTLTMRNWQYYLLPLLRIRAYLRQRISEKGPKGVFRRAWTGIRPSQATVLKITPIPLECVTIHRDKWLFFGKC
jgi:ubiquinone/menaquinone biosynthesis C-methylase UbiE